ncbi:MAG: GNAT family N-acetyltransferase [Pseudomonadota bacterium]
MADATVTVTYLEMRERPRAPVPPAPAGPRLAVLRAETPPVHWFLYLYRSVGQAYGWTDWLRAPAEDVERFVGDPQVRINTLMLDGWPAGFFMLDHRTLGVTDLAYFGLMPEAVGRRLGFWFLSTAVDAAWAEPGTRCVTVNTCTLDHPRALGLYQRVGFVPVRREERPLD